MPPTEPSQSALRGLALQPLALGEVRPEGWLADQLQLLVDGMAGHLDEIWPDVGQSAWIGGSAEGWERGPYWLDAVVPLAALTQDRRLQQKVETWVQALLAAQDDSGWIAPPSTPEQLAHLGAGGHQDVWPRMVILKALLQQYSATEDERILTACLGLARRIHEVLAVNPLHQWGRARWAELVLSTDELYDLTGESWLLDLAETAREQGYDWHAFARTMPYREKYTEAMLREQEAEHGDWFNDHMLATHGVNVAMGLKALPVWFRHGDGSERQAFEDGLAQLDEFHGQATGVFTCDEHLAGTSPSQGTETCTVVELLFSLEVALSTWGSDESVIDRWERVAYNALPGSARDTETGHQYDQQSNQVICHVTEDRVYTNNGPDANIFGFAPHFGCCTANRHQGWPKFAARTWMRSDDDGLAALTYAPCTIATEVRGRDVHLRVHGDYPFGDRVRIDLSVTDAVEFPLHLRVPAWAHGSTAKVDDGSARALVAGTSLRLQQQWSGTHRIELHLPAPLTAMPRPHSAIALRRGPILFALAVEEGWRRLGGEAPYDDWEVHPESPWNYALLVDPEAPAANLIEHRRTLQGSPFSRASVPISLVAQARRVRDWGLEHGAATPPPSSPLDLDTPVEGVTLLPYGASRLRVTELPWSAPAPRAPGA